MQFGKSGDCRGASPLRDIPNGAHQQWDLLGHVHRVCRRVWSACFFRGSNAPSVSDRWAVEGVHGNYYAITHKPIDLDWTPGGRAARSRARPDLLQGRARKRSKFSEISASSRRFSQPRPSDIFLFQHLLENDETLKIFIFAFYAPRRIILKIFLNNKARFIISVTLSKTIDDRSYSWAIFATILIHGVSEGRKAGGKGASTDVCRC